MNRTIRKIVHYTSIGIVSVMVLACMTIIGANMYHDWLGTLLGIGLGVLSSAAIMVLASGYTTDED